MDNATPRLNELEDKISKIQQLITSVRNEPGLIMPKIALCSTLDELVVWWRADETKSKQ